METALCKKSPKSINFFINGIVHILILLTILSVFYFVYISNLARDRFHDELADVINNNLTEAIEKADKDQTIKNKLKTLDLKRISAYYNKNSETTDLENGWLVKATVGILLMITLTLVIVLFVVKTFCKKIPFSSILKENAIMFGLIGLVEVAFFFFIARKFVPTKPSLVMQSFVDSLKNNFSDINK